MPVVSAVTWLALALAVVLVPLPSQHLARAHLLSVAGRLGASTGADRAAIRMSGRTATALASAGIASATAWAALVAGIASALAVLAAAATGAHVVRTGLRRRRARRERAQLLAAIRLIVAEVEAGASLQSALRSAAHASGGRATAFRAAADAAQAGEPVDRQLSDHRLAPLAHACRVAAATGAPVAVLLRRVCDTLGDAARSDDELNVALAGPRSTAVLLAALPAVGIALGALSGAGSFGWLFADRGGRVVCCAGVLLDAAGVLWTQRILDRAEARG